LDKEEEQRLHREITKQGFNLNEIIDTGIAMFYEVAGGDGVADEDDDDE
jgi:hypothetical protein